MTAIQPLETWYGGCRFRSRHEARWAVFLTRLGLDWEYEPQGFIVGQQFGRPRPYLPDFYLPTLGLYVEIKPALADQVDPDGVKRWEDFAGEVAAEWDHDRAAMFCGPIPNPAPSTRTGRRGPRPGMRRGSTSLASGISPGAPARPAGTSTSPSRPAAVASTAVARGSPTTGTTPVTTRVSAMPTEPRGRHGSSTGSVQPDASRRTACAVVCQLRR